MNNAIAVENAIKRGRYETWLVRTLLDGRTQIKVLDTAGKSKDVDTSKILLPGRNLSGAQP